MMPDEANHSSLHLNYLFDSSGCDEWNGDASMDDPLHSKRRIVLKLLQEMGEKD